MPMIASLTWKAFNNWSYVDIPREISFTWRCFDSLEALLKKAYGADYDEFGRLLEFWNERYSHFRGDPNNFDWEAFRPLRLQREEDWSDWLAFFIESSTTGYFSRALFSTTGTPHLKRTNFVAKKVLREDTEDPFRADIIVNWKDDLYTHLEVKIGDMSYAKTFGTSCAMQNKYAPDKCSNFILLLPEQLGEWESIRQRDQEKYPGTVIDSILWTDVAIALRKSALFSNENLTWQAWAYAYIGAIERKLLRIPILARVRGAKSLSYANAIRVGNHVLTEGRNNEARRRQPE